MTNTDTTTSNPQLIAISRLEKSPLNARRTMRTDGMAELKASILAHGLMQNLVVTDAGDGTFHVIAGGRRLEAIRSLQAEGKLPEDFAVPCQIVTESHAFEMSLAENTVRLAMHPADQFEAFARLIEEGLTAVEVAERFGIEESLVHKRMKLARVAPALLQEYRNEGMTLECLVAFTITDDHKRQIKVFKSLQDWQKEDPTAIRDALTEKFVDAGSKLALFVGLDAYRAAGGPTRADLFSEEVYLEKPALLNRLAEAKLDGIRKELEAEGWGWVEINPEREYTLINRCSRIQPRLIGAPSELVDFKSRLDAELNEIARDLKDPELEEKDIDHLKKLRQTIEQRLDENEQQLAAYIGFEADQKALAGCFVSIGQGGATFVDKGLVRPEHQKQLAKLLGTPEKSTGKQKPKGQLPESLRRDLAVTRLQVAQVEIAKHPAIALDLLVFQVATTTLVEDATVEAAEVQFKRPRLYGKCETETPASSALAGLAEALPVEWLKPKTEAARFEAFRLLPDSAKLDLLAYCLSLSLKPKLAPLAGDEATAYDIALSLTGADVAAYWRPTAANFLSRLKRDQLLAAGRDMFGEAWSQAHADDKKAKLVAQLDSGFSNPERSGRMPEQVEKLKNWLPAGMGFDLAAAPKPAKARKARKAA